MVYIHVYKFAIFVLEDETGRLSQTSVTSYQSTLLDFPEE
jgi:hypothetical protein